MSHPVFLRNGDQVKINDHVYCSPSWEARDGTPYSIARIMEFLPPEDVPKGPEGKNYLYTRVRLAWYYRPSDVSDRTVADSRLLLAAIYSEVCDINQLRGKCYVVHRDKISDLSGWKKRPDRFYFNRLFDPYIKKEFEVIQSTDVRNLPDRIRENLISRYEYIVAEKEVVIDLTDNVRLCATCNEWCPSAENVQCDRCKKYFHMSCVQPPLQAKPSRGYGWTCAPCSRKHEEEVDSHDVRYPTPTAPRRTNAPPARGRGRPRKDRAQAEREENFPVKHFNMWPFRYFGQYTVAEDTLDPEDSIFPRTATRQGPKYQANVPPAPDPYNHPPDTDERGGDNTVDVLGIINSLTEAEVAEVESCKRSLTNDMKLQASVDWLTEVIRRFSEAALAAHPFTAVDMKSKFRVDKWTKQEAPFRDEEWTREEIITFEDAIMHHNAELRAVRDEVVTRTMPEVVRFYGHWKNQKLGEQHKRIKEVGETSQSIRRQYHTDEEASNGQRVGLSDDETSIVAEPASKTPTCGACRTRDSPTWWKAPKGLSSSILCESCGAAWRKYADLNLVRQSRDESLSSNKTRLSANDKREGTPLSGPSSKRPKTSASVQSTPPPPSTAPQIRCFACTRTGPLGKVLKCQKCEVRVHAGSCGAFLPDPTKPEKWICDLCDNENTQEASLNPDCVLCPRGQNEDRRRKPYPPADSFLRLCKPTEQQCWAHLLCAVFSSEIVFADVMRLRLVENINIINHHRWATKCTICRSSQGAVIRCSDCMKEYHVSCAWKNGYKFGFEIQPVKSSRRDTTVSISFKGESGCMNAIVSCKTHDHSRRSIYDMCETNEGGETALQVYVQAYKQAQIGQIHGLLRKARRLDNIIATRSNSSSSSAAPSTLQKPSDPECSLCQTQFSPAFYYEDDPTRFPAQRCLCHKCHWNIELRNRIAEDTQNSTSMVVS
ncbi:putative PHD type zinc finger protein with BAH domain-containing protein [Leucoagaricus gongylophorus]